MGMEIKKTQRLASADFRIMKEVGKVLGTAWRGGLLVYIVQKVEKLADPDIWGMPFSRLFMSCSSTFG